MPTKDVSGSDSPTCNDGHKTGNPTLEVSAQACWLEPLDRCGLPQRPAQPRLH